MIRLVRRYKRPLLTVEIAAACVFLGGVIALKFNQDASSEFVSIVIQALVASGSIFLVVFLPLRYLAWFGTPGSGMGYRFRQAFFWLLS